MKGENDAFLIWPLNCEITVQVLNWREDRGHVEKIIPHYKVPLAAHTRVVDGETAQGSWIIEPFILHSDIQYSDNKTEYLHDDTLCFRVYKTIIHIGNKTYHIL